jgi:hypothetical protein
LLEQVADDIWIAEGPTVQFLRIAYPTRMVLVRLDGGGLWAWSPIALSEDLAAQVRDLGEVTEIVAPNKIHHLFLEPWAQAWPAARLHAAPGLASKRTDLSFATELGDSADPAWSDSIEQVVFRGSGFMQEVVFFHRPSRTAIVTDLIQRFDPNELRGWRRVLMTLDGLVGVDGSTPREWRASFLNRRAARAALERAMAWDPQRVIIAHGEWARTEGRKMLSRSLRWIARPPPL